MDRGRAEGTVLTDRDWLGLLALTGCRMGRLRRPGPGGGERPHGSALAEIACAEWLPDGPTAETGAELRGASSWIDTGGDCTR